MFDCIERKLQSRTLLEYIKSDSRKGIVSMKLSQIVCNIIVLTYTEILPENMFRRMLYRFLVRTKIKVFGMKRKYIMYNVCCENKQLVQNSCRLSIRKLDK